MSPSEPPRFDLVHQPWLRARDLDGRVAEHGILDTFAAAHRLVGLAGDVPTQTFALNRMLLAVLHAALDGPRDKDEWRELWRADTLPVPRVAEYLARHSERFDLFSPTTPFLQVADLRTAKGDTAELSKLIADVPNGVPFFTTRFGADLSLSYAEAARWLVHCHAFDPSGIKSGAVGDTRVKNGKGYPIGVGWSGLLGGVLLEGATLKETLLLNLLARDFGDFARDPRSDRPAWERPPVTAAADEEQGADRTPTGPVDLYTWQSRRVRLVPANGCVERVLICNGDRLTPQNMHTVEPHTGWRRSAAQEKKRGQDLVYMPREHDPDRAIWRGLESLLPATAPRQTDEAAQGLVPGVLDWLGHLAQERLIDSDHQVRVRAVGMVYGSNNSVTDDVIDDTLALRAVLAGHDAVGLARVATSCVEAAEKAATALGHLAGDLAAAAGGTVDGPRSRARERAYAELDAPFRRWLSGLSAGIDTADVQADWHGTARSTVRMAADELLTRVPPATWEGRDVRGHVLTAAHADARFRSALRAALPMASAPKPAERTA